MSTRDNNTDRLLHELFGPTPRPARKIPYLTLYNPWTRMHHLYRLRTDGLVKFRTLGPVSLRDAKRIEQAYRENGA
ncbi:hypothetical protein [Cupriavidus pinatubonensis]|nr:hypothetical protein [Cupriavidus pinatubonensis]